MSCSHMSAHVERHMGIVMHMSGLYVLADDWYEHADMASRASGGRFTTLSEEALRNHISEDGKRYLFILWCGLC